MRSTKKIIIGITGTKAAGKDAFIKILEEYGFVSFSLADIVRDEAGREGRLPTTSNLQDIGNRLRELHGNAVLAERTAKKIAELQNASRLAINGMRNPAEIEFFQREFGDDFILIGIDADEEIRLRRYLDREGVSREDFEKDNQRDLGEKEAHGQQVAQCLNLAREIIYNNGTPSELREKGERLLREYFGIEQENKFSSKEIV